jgi:hypothetical protein
MPRADDAGELTARPARPAVDAAARQERAAILRRTVLRMDPGEPDGVHIAAELSRSREDEPD